MVMKELDTPNLILIDSSSKSDFIFCVHAFDGGVGSYLDLAKELSAGATVYGISALDFIGKWLLPESIPSIARRYIQQVQAVQKSAPLSVGRVVIRWIDCL